MFSQSMIASSTTSPSAIASPPSTMMLRLMPAACSTSTAVISDSGIATAETNAVRAL